MWFADFVETLRRPSFLHPHPPAPPPLPVAHKQTKQHHNQRMARSRDVLHLSDGVTWWSGTPLPLCSISHIGAGAHRTNFAVLG